MGHFHQVGLVPSLGHIELHLTASLLVQGLLQGLHIRRQLVHRNDPGDLLVVQVIPGQKLLSHGVDIRRVVEQKLPFVRQPPLPEPQHGGAHAAGGASQGHHVHFHLRVHHHLLPGTDLGDGLDLIPQQGGGLKLQPLRGLQHPLVQGPEDLFFAVADQVHRPFYRLVIGLAADPAAAHRHALADVGIEAGAALAQVLGEPLAAPGQQKGIHGGLCHLPGRKGRGVGAQILGVVLLLLQHKGQPGPRLPGHLDIAVALVVLQQDVVFGGVGLDLAGLQHQGLKLALADDDIKGVGVGDHLAHLVVVGHALPEILAHPYPQPLGLADIDDGVAFVPDDVHPRQQRQHAGFLVKLGLGHPCSLPA